MVKSIDAVTPAGKGIGLRSTGTGVIVICDTGLPSGPTMVVPAGTVTTKPGIVGVVTCTVCVVDPDGTNLLDRERRQVGGRGVAKRGLSHEARRPRY